MLKTLIKILVMLNIAWVPMGSFSADVVKFRHILSIYSDENGVGLKQPEGVACSQESLLIVADTGNGRLLRYTFRDKTLQPGSVEIKLPQLMYPVKAEINSKNEIYVLDGKQRRILCLTAEGEFKRYFKPRGLSSPAPIVSKSFTIDRHDNIYILDILSKRVLALNSEGEYRRHINFPKDYGFFSDLVVDHKGTIILIDSTKATVFSAGKNATGFSPLTQNLKQFMRFPTSLDTDKRGRIHLVDRNGSKIIILGQDGSFLGRLSAMGWREGFLNYPSQLCLNNKGEIFIADTNNNRIQIFAVIE
jgi:sugar lactone lactonase YvrE